jgi:dCMP deaminase
MNRPTWHQYFMSIATLVAQRASCKRGQVGAVLVKNHTIISTGYNGAPSNTCHCTDFDCNIAITTYANGEQEENCQSVVHAEINAIINAAVNGVSIAGATIYITHSPCRHCYKALINAGIKTIYYKRAYKLESLRSLVQPEINLILIQ